MVTSKDMKFIKIEKQEDLPTNIEIKGRLSGATQLEELALPNGDILVSNKDFQEINSSVPINVEASLLFATMTGSKEIQIRGHCYLIKLNIKYWPKRPTSNRTTDIKQTLRYAHLAPTNLIAAVDVINKINGNGNADTAYSQDTKKYREGDKEEVSKIVNNDIKNIINRNEPIVHDDTTVRLEDGGRLL